MKNELIKVNEILEAEIRSLDFKPYKNNYNKVNELLIDILKEKFIYSESIIRCYK
jgi:hypothetical protein